MHVIIIRVIVCIACGLGAFFAFESSAQALIAVQSRKVHAAVGTYDIKVDTTKSISGAITVDPRAIGSGHRIVFQFDGPAITPSSVTVVDPQGATIGANTISVLGTEVSVDLTGIPDNSRVTVSLRDGAASVYASASLGFLRGDVNNNRAVDSNDVSAVKVRSGLAASTTNVRFDVGTSGAINASDIAAVKSRIGNALAVAGQQAKLTLVKAGTGSGTLFGSGVLFAASAGIACPPVSPGVCSSSSAYFDVGSTVTLTATPASGSTFSGWSGLCASGTVVIAADSSCTATFAGPVTYAVTPSAGANGTISPASVQNIVQGATTTFTVTPGIGYTASVAGTCGGTLVGTIYTTNAISAACTVVASFSSVNFSVTPSAGTNGVINPSTVQTVPQGTTKTFTVSPNANYTPSVAGTCGGTLTGLSYTTNPVTANCTVSATFVRLSYTVTPSAGANGTISPSTAQTVLNGATKAFVVTPSAGYAAIVGGTCGGTLVGTTYTTNPITGLCSVVATFVSNTPKYVSTTGNDSTGDGTIGNPWKTIGKGISMLVGGESLIVRNGIYSGTSNFITAVPSGISTRYTTITAETPMQVRIQSTSALGVGNNQLQLTGSYIKVDGFIFDMTGTTNPAFTGLISGSFNTLSRSIFKRGGDIDAFGGLLEVTGSDNLLEDMAGTGACAICFKQGGATVTTQRNIWRRVIGRFDYSNSSQPKATFATFGGATVGNVRDHLYQNVIAIDGQNPGTLGGAEKMGGFYAAQNTANITLQGSMVLNEGAGSAGMFLRELGSINNTSHSVVWDLRNGLSGATGMVGGNADHLTIGGIIPGAAVDLITSATASLLKPGTNPANLLNNTPGAVMLKQYGLSGTRWGQTGYDQITSVDLWPWPYQDTIKSVFREANNVPAGNGPAQNDTLRGFAANGTALYGGAKTFTSYIWEYLGAPCPPTACVTYTVTPSAGANGTISPTTPQTVLPGSTLIFTLTPNAGYTSSVGGTCGGTLVGSTYTTNLISASCTVVASFNTFKTYYVSNSGNNVNTCAAALSSGTPKQTIQAGLACLAAGDSLVIRDGIYSGAANALTSLPNGTAGNYITIKAENEGSVILTSGLQMDHSDAYLIFNGLRFQDATDKTILGNHIKFFRNEFKGGCPSGNCTNTTIGTNDFNDTADILFEDNWWHGTGGRYTVLVYNSNRVVFRRAVVRHDGGWTDTKGDPEAGFNFYNSTLCSAQNVIVLDSTLPYTSWQSAFYNVLNSASPNTNANNSWLGVIALNNVSPGATDGASLRFDGNAAQVGHVVRDAVFWDSNWGINVSYQANIGLDASGLTIGQTSSGSVGYGVAGGSGGTKTFTNAIVANMINTDLSGVSATYFDTFNNGTTASGTGRVTYNPRTNGLLYLPRIETGTPLKTAGSAGGQIGAQIVNRMGTDNSLQGEAGWNTLTSTALWPFPNEARIKKEMCTDTGITRGFCANASLTNYIMNYLGNGNPYP